MSELTPEEVLAQLRTRGFDEGFGPRTPLREFNGRLVSITGNMNTNVTPPRLQVLYNFEEVEVIHSVEPYTDPIAQIIIGQSVRKQSGMGIWGQSVDKVLNADVPENEPATLEDGSPNPNIRGQGDLQGKVLHLKMTGGHMLWDGRQNKEVPRECWELVEVIEEAEPVKPTPKKASPPAQVKGKAVAGENLLDKVLGMIDGKNGREFAQAFFNDPILKKSSLVSKVIGNTLIPELLSAEQITQDEDGVYHKEDMVRKRKWSTPSPLTE